MQSLDELRRVIRRIETRRPPRPAAPPAHEVLGGELVETGAGPLLIVRREYPLTHIHGRQPLAPAFAAPLDLLSAVARDRKSTRLNSSHDQISYAVFCLKKKKTAPVTSATRPTGARRSSSRTRRTRPGPRLNCRRAAAPTPPMRCASGAGSCPIPSAPHA